MKKTEICTLKMSDEETLASIVASVKREMKVDKVDLNRIVLEIESEWSGYGMNETRETVVKVYYVGGEEPYIV